MKLIELKSWKILHQFQVETSMWKNYQKLFEQKSRKTRKKNLKIKIAHLACLKTSFSGGKDTPFI